MNRDFQYVWGYTAVNLVSALAILCCRDGNQLDRWAESRALVYVGQISYGIYVFHLPMLQIVKAWWPFQPWTVQGGITSVLYGLAVVLVSGLSFRLFERRILAFKDRCFVADSSALASSRQGDRLDGTGRVPVTGE
jgi:peptidoglycan/LPS O-acetylase OafA/YrhL